VLLRQFFVLSPRLQQDWDVRVGILPERKEILIGFATFRHISGERRRTRDAQVGKRNMNGGGPDTAAVNYLLEFGHRLSRVALAKISLGAEECGPTPDVPSHVVGINLL